MIAGTEQRTLLAREWAEAFAYVEPNAVHKAIGKLKLTSKWFPKVSEIWELVEADAPPPPRHTPVAAEAEGPQTPEEHAKVQWFFGLLKKQLKAAPADVRWSMPSEIKAAERAPLPPGDPVAEAASIARITASLRKGATA